ncbi:TerB family tellurite resistance protein [Fulvivirga lutea]|uniref:TerB family tellurite resistance protein n=1 Tax=Fulvivirga lutea TaxID=2810512 RepID=A0A974WFT6_9BACT|nr:TerB family tellurite resistance protein [Fulvivirga lutea]QSE96337.1 TerB family tellurite resistance protein [Fulvivirga lutea]
MKFTEILNLFKQGKSQAHSHIKNLIEIAAADGNFDDVEYKLLQSIAKKHGISESKLKEIQNNPESVEFEVPEKAEDKFGQFYDLVHMMIVDKEIHHEEMKLCNLFGAKFGYDKKRMDELIKTIQGNIENGNSSDDTYKRIAWML